MTRDDFNAGLKRMAAVFSKTIKKDRAEILFEELSWIPDNAWTVIIKSALENWDAWPRNFVKEVKGLWYSWQRNEEAKYELEECHVCHQEGMLKWKKVVEGVAYQGEVACGYCFNYKRVWGEKRKGIMRLKLNEFDQYGLVPEPLFNNCGPNCHCVVETRIW